MNLHSTPSCTCRPTALVVDDDPEVRALMRRVLTRCGWQAREADCIEQGRRALAESSYDLLLLDQELPDGTGLELLAWWRDRERRDGLPATPVITVTSLNSVDFAERARALRAADCLNKPVSLYEVRFRLHALEARLGERPCPVAPVDTTDRPPRAHAPRRPPTQPRWGLPERALRASPQAACAVRRPPGQRGPTRGLGPPVARARRGDDAQRDAGLCAVEDKT